MKTVLLISRSVSYQCFRRRYGYQTLTVPTDKYRFFTSSSRDPPADDGPCDPQDVKTLATAELKTQNYCRLFKHPSDEWCTVEAISAADTWLLSNGFERGACIQKSSETFHMEHIREITNYDDLRNDLLNMIDGFSDQQLLDAENCLSTIADEQQHYCWNGEKCQDNADCGPRDMCAFNYWQEYIGNIGDVSHRLFNRRTCPGKEMTSRFVLYAIAPCTNALDCLSSLRNRRNNVCS